MGYGRYMKFKHDLSITQTNNVVQKRLKTITFLEKHGLEATIDAFSVSKTSIYRWRKTLKDHNQDITYLIPKSTKPKNTRRMCIDSEILSFIRNLRELNYRLGKEKIKPLLDMYCSKEHLPKISESLIGKIIKRNNLTFKKLGKPYHDPNRKPYPKFIRQRLPKDHSVKSCGDLVQMDTVVRYDLNTRKYILTAIDLFSRFTFAFAYSTLNSRISLDFFKKLEVIAPFSIKAIKTDNGLEFLGDFDDHLLKSKITHFFSYPRTPKSNAFIERFNRTIQEEFVDNNLEYFMDAEVLNQKLMDYLIYYNQVRPHKSLNNQTPMGYLVSKDILSHMSVTSTFY